MLRFTENLVYGDTHDLCLKNALRGGTRSPADAMQTASVKGRLDEIMDLRNSEKIKESATTNASSSSGDNRTSAVEAGKRAAEAGDGLTSPQPAMDDEATVFAKRTFHSYLTLHVETESKQDLKLALSSSSLGNVFGSQNLTNVLVVFDVKHSAEPNAQPHIRIAPLTRLRTLVTGVMEARCETAGKPLKTLIPGDLYMMPDGGRRISSKFRSLFIDEETKVRMGVVRHLNV